MSTRMVGPTIISGPKTPSNPYGIYGYRPGQKKSYTGDYYAPPKRLDRPPAQKWSAPSPSPGAPTPMGKGATQYAPIKPMYMKLPELKLPPLKGAPTVPSIPYRRIMKLTPWTRMLSVGFDVLDFWMTTQEEQPYKPAGFDLGPEWTMACGPALVPGACNFGHSWHSSANPQSQLASFCGLTGQIVGSKTPGNQLPAGTTLYEKGRTTDFGSSCTLSQLRMRYEEVWWRAPAPAPRPAVPWLPEQQPIPRIVQPMPGGLEPPDPVWGWKERDRRRYRPRMGRRIGPRYDIETTPRARPRTQTKPKPYDHNGVRTLPKYREKKFVFVDPWFAKVYGWLTEIQDALECFEKNALKRPSARTERAGLHTRLYEMALLIADDPRNMDWAGLGKCLVVNQFEDYIIGKSNQLANRAFHRTGYTRSPHGIGRGGFSQRMR